MNNIKLCGFILWWIYIIISLIYGYGNGTNDRYAIGMTINMLFTVYVTSVALGIIKD